MANSPDTVPVDPAGLDAFERMAWDFAAGAGAEMMASRDRALEVSYKLSKDDGSDASAWTDPVTDVDRAVERHIRERLSEYHPGHTVIGEEMGADWQQSEFAWAIDPVDGTANFLNGFPLFCASIGLLWQGRPIAGAVWCSASHALRPGVYHTRAGGKLCFDGAPIHRPEQPGVRRRLIGLPASAEGTTGDIRTTGSAALECAFVAAGLLAGARFTGVNLWDVAAGIALVEASGGVVLQRRGREWLPFDGFAGWMTDAGRLFRNDLVLADDPVTAESLTM